jgi:hypothetical protein
MSLPKYTGEKSSKQARRRNDVLPAGRIRHDNAPLNSGSDTASLRYPMLRQPRDAVNSPHPPEPTRATFCTNPSIPY